MTQLSLLTTVMHVERPRKRVRQVSRGTYAELRDSGQLAKREGDVLRELAAFYNRRAQWPTVGELTLWMFEHGDIPRNDTRLVAPRMTELCRTHQVVEPLPARPCAVLGSKAHSWRVTEAGAKFAVGV